MFISYFGNKLGKFECVNVEYTKINHPITIESHRIFNERLDTLKKERGWDTCMFNPVPEVNDVEYRQDSEICLVQSV